MIPPLHYIRSLTLAGISLLFVGTGLNAQASDATHCLVMGTAPVSWAEGDTRTFRNSCNQPIQFFWCLPGASDTFKSRRCNKKKYYRGSKALKPDELAEGYYNFPASEEIEFGACFGKYSAVTVSGGREYVCKTDLAAHLAACETNIANCELDGSSPDKVAVRCADGSSVDAEIVTTVKNDVTVVAIKSGGGMHTFSDGGKDTSQLVTEKVLGLCEGGHFLAREATLVSYLNDLIYNRVLLLASRELKKCMASAQSENDRSVCEVNFRRSAKARSTAIGVRG